MSDEEFAQTKYRRSEQTEDGHHSDKEIAESRGHLQERLNRRSFLAGTAGLLGMIATSSCSWQEFFQQNFRKMSKKEIQETIDRLQDEYKAKYGKEFVVGTESPIEGTLFGYGLDI